jgi:hypothetical protein
MYICLILTSMKIFQSGSSLSNPLPECWFQINTEVHLTWTIKEEVLLSPE